ADGDNTPSATDGTSFGLSLVGKTRTFKVTNTGLANLVIPTISTSGDFSVVADPTLTFPVVVAPGGDASFGVRMSGGAGAKSGTVALGTNVTGKDPFDFAVSGSILDIGVIDPGPIVLPPPAAEITVTDGATPVDDGAGTVNFGSVVKDSASPTKTFTVRNDGDADLTLGAPALPAGFTLTEPLAATLAAGASDTFSVAVDTAAVGARSGTISIATNDADENPFDFTVQAAVTAAATPAIVVKNGGTSLADGSSTVDFGTASVGGGRPTRTFTVRNDGTAPLTLGTPTVPAGFEVTEPLDATLAPGASDTFTVSLQTAAEGTPQGQLSIANDDATKNPFNFTIKGKVVAAPAADASVAAVLNGATPVADGQATPVDFGSSSVGQAGPVVTFTVRNDGGSPLTIGAPTLPLGFALVEGLTPTLAPGATDTFQVSLSTAAQGTFSGSVSIPTNDTVRNPYDFAVSGFVAPAVAAPVNNSPVVVTMDASKLPALVVGGTKKAKGTVTLRVTNGSATAVAGRLAGSLFASTDLAADGGDQIVGSVNKVLKLKPGQAKSVKVKLTFAAPAADGTFSVLAPLSFEGATAGQANSDRQVQIQTPRVTLAGQSVGSGGSAAFGGKVKLAVPVLNTGNVPAKGTMNLDLIASIDGTVSTGTSFTMATLNGVKFSAKPGQTKSVKLSFTVPPTFPAPFAAGAYTLIVRVASSSLGAAGVADGQTLAAIPFTVV
ncbi:MAG TPA: choice-of-anchor D domain-containing protein, partial [Humisphaera sp.]